LVGLITNNGAAAVGKGAGGSGCAIGTASGAAGFGGKGGDGAIWIEY